MVLGPGFGGRVWNGGGTARGTKLAEVAGRTVAGRSAGAPAERGQGSRRPPDHRRARGPRPFGHPEPSETGLVLA